MTSLPQEDPSSRVPDLTPPAEDPILITDSMLVPLARHSGRVDFERGMSYAPRVTLLLIAANLAVFVWQLLRGALSSTEAIIAAGALSQPEVFRGELWRLLTSMFLHGSADHILGNCIALYVLGMACEHAVGAARMLGLYLLSGLTGAVASVTLSEGPSVGASGAIFGIMAAVTVLLHVHQDRFRARDKRIGAVLAVWAIYTVATGLLTPFVDNVAHLGGFLGGFLAGRTVQPIHRG